MSNETLKASDIEPSSNEVVLEKHNYLQMMKTIRWLLMVNLGLGLALAVTVVKLINTHRNQP